jgi:hypothetical protein
MQATGILVDKYFLRNGKNVTPLESGVTFVKR